MDVERTLTLSEEAIAHLRADPALSRGMVPRLYRTHDESFGVQYGRTRIGDLITTYAGFSVAIDMPDVDLVRGRELHYDSHHGFVLRRRPVKK